MRADDRDLDPIPHSPAQAPLIWLGGGDEREIRDRNERATYAVAGVIVLAGVALTCLTAAAAAETCTGWPLPVVVATALLAGVLVGALSRAVATGPRLGRRSTATGIAVALGVGVIVGELAALVIFAGSIDRQTEQLAARDAASAPAVAQASASLDRARDARAALDDAVEQARRNFDDALVVARCEYHPTPACPQTRITGVPGAGPETRTAKDYLADARRELDRTVALRDRRVPELDDAVDTASQTLRRAEQAAAGSTGDTGLGARWLAMNDYSGAHPGTMLLRLAMIGLFTLLTLLPGIFKLWRGEGGQERRAAARAAVEHAELQAATAAAVRRAELRAEAEILWAEQQLASARSAIAAQTEIEEAQQRRRVAEALGGPVAVASQRGPTAGEDEMYLPIEAEAAAAAEQAVAGLPGDLPAPAKQDHAVPREGALPSLPGIARSAARWVRPLVPPLLARAVDSTIRPIQAVQQVFEEVEEVTFTVKRSRKINVGSVTTQETPRSPASMHWLRGESPMADDPAGALPPADPPALPPGGPPALQAGDPPALPAGGPPALRE